MHDVLRDFFIWLTAFLCLSAGLFLLTQRMAKAWRRRRAATEEVGPMRRPARDGVATRAT